MTYDLTEDKRNTIDNALMVAAECFRENAKVLVAEDHPEKFVRLAEQFTRQAEAADQLREELANAEYIRVEEVPAEAESACKKTRIEQS